jgi:hypothetical protein
MGQGIAFACLILAANECRVARSDKATVFKPVQAGAHGPLGQAGVTDQGAHRGERPGPIRPSMVGEADEHEPAPRRLPRRSCAAAPADRCDPAGERPLVSLSFSLIHLRPALSATVPGVG